MKFDTSIKKRHRIALQTLGGAPEIYNKLSATALRKKVNMGYILIAIAIFSGLIISLGVSYHAFNNILLAPLIFVIWTPIILLIDRFLLLASNNGNIGGYLLRIFLIIVIGVINAVFFDLIVFEKDISGELTILQFEALNSIESTYDHRIENLDNKIDKLNDSNSGLTYEVIDASTAVNDEIDGLSGTEGYGSEAKAKEETSATIKNASNNLIATNNGAISQYQNELAEMKAEMNSQKDTYKNASDVGVLIKIEALHRVAKKNKSVLVFSIIWFLFLVLIESLPLIMKQSDDMTEFHLAVDLDGKTRMDVNTTQTEIEKVDELMDLQNTHTINQLTKKNEFNLEYHRRMMGHMIAKINDGIKFKDKISKMGEKHSDFDVEEILKDVFKDVGTEYKQNNSWWKKNHTETSKNKSNNDIQKEANEHTTT